MSKQMQATQGKTETLGRQSPESLFHRSRQLQIAAPDGAAAPIEILTGVSRRSDPTAGQAPHADRTESGEQLKSYLDLLQGKQDILAAKLAVLLASIPSLNQFADRKISEQLAQDYPGTEVDALRTTVQVQYRNSNLTRALENTAPRRNIRTLSLRDVILNNTAPWSADGSEPLSMTAVLREKSGKPAGPHQIVLDMTAMNSLARRLNIGKNYTDVIAREFSLGSRGGKPKLRRDYTQLISETKMWAELYKARLNPDAMDTFSWQSRDDPYGPRRGLRYIDAVLTHPDPSNRPSVDGHEIVANTLTIGAMNANAGGGQQIRGVVAIGSSQPKVSPAVVLYTPDAPDNIPFREFSTIDEARDLVNDPDWNSYFSARMSTSDQNEIDRILQGRESVAGNIVLEPIRDNLHFGLYRQAIGHLIAHAKHRSTTNSQVDSISLANKTVFAVEAVASLVDFLPAAQAGLRAAINSVKRLRPSPPAVSVVSPPPAIKGTPPSPPPAAALPTPRPAVIKGGTPPPPPAPPSSNVPTAQIAGTTDKSRPSRIRAYLQSDDVIKSAKLSDSAIDRGTYLADDGRRYIRLIGEPGGSGKAANVVPVGKQIWQLHSDGEVPGPLVKYDVASKTWRTLTNVKHGPVKSKWDTASAFDFQPSNDSPVIYRNLNGEPLTTHWDASKQIDVAALSKEMNAMYATGERRLEVRTVTGRKMAEKMGLPYDAANPKSNPAAWTSPEGVIHIASDAPDFAVNGALDVAKVRSTVVHEAVHSLSANHTGLQNVTLAHGEVGLSTLNIDESVVDYFAHQLYRKLYPKQPYKSGYFVAEGSLWMGETVNFLEKAGVMNKALMRDALFKDPTLFKDIPQPIKNELRAWSRSGPHL